MARDTRGEVPIIFADIGDTAPPTVANFDEGYELAFEQTAGKKPTREGTNKIYQQLYAMGRDISQFGGALPYSQTIDFLVDAVVTEAGILYTCLLVNGPTTAVKIPGAVGSETFWSAVSGALWSNMPTVTKVTAATIVTGEIGSFIQLNKATDDTFTLPSLAAAGDGAIYGFGAIGAGALILDGDGADTIEGATTIVIPPGGRLILRASSSTQWEIVASHNVGPFESQLLHVREEQASGVDAGTFTSGADRTRVLNTIVTNEIGAGLSSNQITGLLPGDYIIMARAPGRQVEGHQAKIYNVTGAANLIMGGVVEAGIAAQTDALVWGKFTLTATSIIELRHRCSTTVAGTGLGGAQGSFGDTSVYAEIMLWKVG